MRFPGKRKNKHYFPVSEKALNNLSQDTRGAHDQYIVGIEQLIIDIVVEACDDELSSWALEKAQSSIVSDELMDKMYYYYKEKEKITGVYPGGSIGNTLHNFSLLSDTSSYALGCINKLIEVGDYSFSYICATNANVKLNHIQPKAKPLARALCLVTEDGERTFAISRGCMDELDINLIPRELIHHTSMILLSSYILRDTDSLIAKASEKICLEAKNKNIPIAFSLASALIIREKKEFISEFVEKYCNVLAGNLDEAYAYTGLNDPLLACEKLLDSVDFVLLTHGEKGLYIASYTEKSAARTTEQPIMSKSIANYNEFEYSRAMLKKNCVEPIKIYNHINPYLGGPKLITNTNGAGDAAFSAVLHDIVANIYHRKLTPDSQKHKLDYLTYSSISQIGKYANRVSYEIVSQESPRLQRLLPEREESLEEDYWDR